MAVRRNELDELDPALWITMAIPTPSKSQAAALSASCRENTSQKKCTSDHGKTTATSSGTPKQITTVLGSETRIPEKYQASTKHVDISCIADDLGSCERFKFESSGGGTLFYVIFNGEQMWLYRPAQWDSLQVTASV